MRDEIKEGIEFMADYQTLEEKLSELLVFAHLTSCGKIMDALKFTEQMKEKA